VKGVAVETETKEDRFVRIAEARTNKAADMIRLLGNCSNRKTYEYSEEDIRKIFAYLESELKIAKSQFSGGTIDEHHFSLR
jgi:hypothetical protein